MFGHYRKFTVSVAVCVLSTGFLLVGCSSQDGEDLGDGVVVDDSPLTPSPDFPTPPPAPPVSFDFVKPKNGVEPYIVNDVVGFKASDGTIKKVELLTKNSVDDVKISSSRGLYRITGVLSPNAEYDVKVTGVNKANDVREQVYHFKTNPAPTTSASVNVGDGQTVGVGMPVMFTFNKPVNNKLVFEKSFQITTSPKTEGSWGWVNSQIVVWRPAEFWKPGTKVNVSTKYNGLHAGGGVFGGKDRSVHFNIGRDFRMDIDDNTHQMKILDKGKVVKTMPVSMGRKTGKHETRSGVKIITQKSSPYKMEGPASDPYEVTVKHAQRLTDSGEFFHGAPWSVWDQGRRNVSHGCVNLSPSNAAWLYNRTLPGDPVITRNTGRKMESWNGPSGVWNMSYAQWKKKSAVK